jgi:hypothetical protein
MTARDDIYQALHDAIGWQRGLVDAWGRDSDEGKEALETIKRYKKILKRRYGTSKNALDKALEGAETVNVFDLINKSRAQP